jgi:hypothetical protein
MVQSGKKTPSEGDLEGNRKALDLAKVADVTCQLQMQLFEANSAANAPKGRKRRVFKERFESGNLVRSFM